MMTPDEHTEMERLRERVAELEPYEPQLKEMNLGPDGWSMTITEAKNASVGFIAAAKGMLDGTGADNYVEQEIILNGEQYVIIYCRPGGKTPHQLRKDAEAEVERLTAQRDRVRQALDTMRTETFMDLAAVVGEIAAIVDDGEPS